MQKGKEFEGRLTISVASKLKSIEIEVKQQEFWKREKANPEQEKFLYNSVRLFSRDAYLDSITVCRKLVENVGVLMECIEVVSAGRSFWNPSTAKEGNLYKNLRGINNEGNKKGQDIAIYDKFPHWFTAIEGGTIYEWLCAYLEEVIVCKYSLYHF